MIFCVHYINMWKESLKDVTLVHHILPGVVIILESSYKVDQYTLIEQLYESNKGIN